MVVAQPCAELVVVYFVHCTLSTLLSFWWSGFWWDVSDNLASDEFAFDDFASDDVSSGALSSDAFSSDAILSDALSFNKNSFALWLIQSEPLWIVLWLGSCKLEQMFSISNW